MTGDPGASTDEGRLEKVRPVPHGQQNSPGPGERVEPRTVVRITPTGDGNQILNFESTPTVNPDDDPNAPGFDEMQDAKRIEETVEETQKTGAFLVGSMMELYVEAAKMVSTERLSGWGLQGAIKVLGKAGKLKQLATGLKSVAANSKKNASQLRQSADKLEDATKGMSKARAANAKKKVASLRKRAIEQDDFAKQATSTSTNSQNYSAKTIEEIKKTGCFVAGTLVWMSDGTTKPIEQVKVGDTVLSKNEKTGEVAAKKVTIVSVRADIWTRKLSFDGNIVLETTDEHPLYVEGSGFAKAKAVGIGSSIVTRAGPSAKVVGVQADVRQATVYNFTVDEFHTYFVGELALWVHNADRCNWDLAVNDVQNASTKLKGSTNGLGPNHPDYNPYVVPNAEEAVRDAMKIAGSPSLKFADEGIRNAPFKVRTPVDQYGKFWQIRYLRDGRNVGPDELAHINVEKIRASDGAVLENQHINWRGRDTGSFDIEGFFKAVAD